MVAVDVGEGLWRWRVGEGGGCRCVMVGMTEAPCCVCDEMEVERRMKC